MDDVTFRYLAVAFAVIAGLSLIALVGLFYGIFRSARAVEAKLATLLPKIEGAVPKVEAMIPKVESLVGSSQKFVEQGREHFLDISSKTKDLLDSGRRQMTKIESVVDDASVRAKNQLEHVEMVLDDTVGRAHQTVSMVHNGINRPLREIQGITAGVRAAMSHLVSGGRTQPGPATHDEEMFI